MSWNPIAAVVEVVGGAYTSYQDGRTKIKKAKIDMHVAEIENKARLLRDEGSHNHEWEMASLKDKDKWLRRVSFAIFVWPITPIGVLFPETVAEYYTMLSFIPEWNLQIIMIMIGGVWGVSELKQTIPLLTAIILHPL